MTSKQPPKVAPKAAAAKPEPPARPDAAATQERDAAVRKSCFETVYVPLGVQRYAAAIDRAAAAAVREAMPVIHLQPPEDRPVVTRAWARAVQVLVDDALARLGDAPPPTTVEHPNSTNLAASTYDALTRRLTVAFRNGARYVYAGVPPETFHGLATADSPGHYLHEHVRTAFPFVRLPAEPEPGTPEAAAKSAKSATAAAPAAKKGRAKA